jgi:hypothetical protein
LLFEKNAKFFTENCDHNIDPRKDKLGWLSQVFICIPSRRFRQKSWLIPSVKFWFVTRKVFFGCQQENWCKTVMGDRGFHLFMFFDALQPRSQSWTTNLYCLAKAMLL